MSRHKYTKKELIILLLQWEQIHGEVPSQSQWDGDVDTPSSNPCRVQFGSWSKALIAAGLEPKKPMFSLKCREASRKVHTGKQGCAWKGGRYVEKKTGYIHLWKPRHPNAVTGHGKQYVLEHRFVMSEILGRPLVRSEQVHHKNGNRSDNRIENLELWSTSQPAGQRVIDKLKWSKEFINIYENPKLIND